MSEERTTVDEIVDLAVGHDERVSAAARQLTATAIIELNNLLKWGTPQAKLQVLRSFIPPLIRQAQSTEGSEEIAQLRKELAEFREEMTTYETPDEDEDPIPDIPTDIE